MTSKERMYAAIEGRPTDCCPVSSPYIMLSNADHWCDVTGEPVWRFYDFCGSADSEAIKAVYRQFAEVLPYDVVQPFYALGREERAHTEVIHRDGVPFLHYKSTGRLEPVPSSIHDAGSGGGENETRFVFSKEDAKRRMRIRSAQELLDEGIAEHLELLVSLFGDEKFIISGGSVNTLYTISRHVGMTELFAMLLEEPELIHYMCELVTQQNIEKYRAFAKVGGDAIYIDDATATSDMISPAMYEEFSLPYLTRQVKEIQRLGKKAILIYFGGIMDRVEQIASTGADVLVMECAMKGFTNDYSEVSQRLGGKMCLAGNLNPYDDIEITTDEEHDRRVTDLLKLGSDYGRFYLSTGSPLTPNTPISRIRRFINAGHSFTGCKL